MEDGAVLAALGASNALLLGHGSEAKVYALGENKIARVHQHGGSMAEAQQRRRLLDAIGRLDLPFAMPSVLSVEAIGNRVVTIERRLPGVSSAKAVEAATGAARRDTLVAFLDGALALMGIGEDDLAGVRLPYMDRNVLQTSGPMGLVHVDYALTNCLSEGAALSAVLDFGPSTMIGDRRFNAWAAVAYLDAELSPALTDEDRVTALAWLTQHGLHEGFEEAKRWLAHYWSFATDDAPLMAWCQRVLKA